MLNIPTLGGDRHHHFGPYDRCIYCGTAGSNVLFSKEHAIPQGLGGTIILKKASCEPCRVITAEFERKVLRDHFGLHRLKHGYKLKRPAEHRRDRFVFKKVGSYRVKVPVGISDYPDQFRLPRLRSYPGIFSAITPDTPYKMSTSTYTKTSEVFNLEKKIGQFSTQDILDFTDLFRMIAKISHCFAVTTVGLDGFIPYLKPLIIDNDRTLIHHLIGKSPFAPFPAATPTGVLVAGRPHIHAGRVYVTVTVRLFADQHPNTPTYCTVAGELSQSGIKKRPELLERMK